VNEEMAVLAHMYLDRAVTAEAKLADAERKIAQLELTVDIAKNTIAMLESDVDADRARSAFASQILSGEFDPPTIAEIRKARGLDPL